MRVDLIEQKLQDLEAVKRSKLNPVVAEVIDLIVEQLDGCYDFRGVVRETIEPIIVTTIRFLARCLNVQEGGMGSRTAYLYRPDAEEKHLKEDVCDWYLGGDLYGLTIEAEHIGGGRIDLVFPFNSFRFVVELKREQGGATRDSLRKALRQTAFLSGNRHHSWDVIGAGPRHRTTETTLAR